MDPVVRQLAKEFGRSGMTLTQLLARSRLPIFRTSLRRKLDGDLRTSTKEAHAIARALGGDLVFQAKAAA
jgi:hypothetical protein